MKTRKRAEQKRSQRAHGNASEGAGEVIGRRVVFIRDNQFVNPRQGRKAAG